MILHMEIHTGMHTPNVPVSVIRVYACDVAGVTILLSQTVFSLLVANVLTRSSEAVPLIGT